MNSIVQPCRLLFALKVRERLKICLPLVLCCALGYSVPAQSSITVDVNSPGHPVSPLLWGIFFEDINLSADGGLYPELVRNRSFEDSDKPDFWRLSNVDYGTSAMAIDTSQALNAFNRHCLRIDASGGFTLENEGYWGMNIATGDIYKLTFAARAADGFNGPVITRLVNSSGAELCRGEIFNISGNWRYYSLEFAPTNGDSQARLQFSGAGHGHLFLDMVSLMPAKTWKNHGLRIDLAQALDALHPSFVRFPGGNWVEGDDIAHMYHWKYTIGNIDARTPLWNTWGYNTTHGLGFYEYLQLCEDLGAEPLFDINAGMSLHDSVPLSQMGQWIQDALDAVEYANGLTNTIWGGLRARAGHPAPFHLKYMEIGNENGGPDYRQRWALLVDAIRNKYPEIKLIANSDLRGRPYPRDPTPDIVDEHYYESPESFMRRANQYDTYDRHSPGIFIGEYAVTQNAGKGNLRAAIGEAAFMTGMERNSDIVQMASYAPLFVNLQHRAWNPDLINFNTARWYGLPSYYVQQMFSANRGDLTLPITVETAEEPESPPTGRIGVGTWNTAAEFKDIKVTSPGGNTLFASDFSKGTDGWQLLGDGAAWKVQDGALRQTGEHEFIRALAGDKSWTDYTLELKARKLSGREGFLVLFHNNDDEDRVWWNIGGWNNTQNALELGSTVDGQKAFIATGRWYDIRVQLNGASIKCWLDGQLIHDVAKPRETIRKLYASATRESKTGDIILKVVNTATNPASVEITLRGATNLSGSGKAIVLTSDSRRDENSIEEPLKVSPKTETFSFQDGHFSRAFPGNSVSVLRIAEK